MDSLKRKERKPDLTSSQVYSLEMWDQLWLREESLRSKIGWCKVAEASFATERNLDKEYFLYTTPRLLSPAFAWRPSIKDAHSLQFTQTTQLIQIQRIYASGFGLSFEFLKQAYAIGFLLTSYLWVYIFSILKMQNRIEMFSWGQIFQFHSWCLPCILESIAWCNAMTVWVYSVSICVYIFGIFKMRNQIAMFLVSILMSSFPFEIHCNKMTNLGCPDKAFTAPRLKQQSLTWAEIHSNGYDSAGRHSTKAMCGG